MIEIDTRIHDRYSIELKVGFVTRKKLRMNDFSLATLCPEANYFFTYGAEIGVLKLFWRIIPAPLLYGLPAPLILAGYMYAVCALSRLTQRAEEASFS